MNKLRKKYTDYVRRLFPAVMDDVIIRSSETSSSVVHASVGITGGLAKININDNCDDDDNVNDEYDSDDNVVHRGGVDNEDCDAEDEDAHDEDNNEDKNETTGGKDVSGSVNEGRKRKNVDRLTTDPQLHAKSRVSKKRFLSKSPSKRIQSHGRDPP